jgi:hypothetical protein
MELVTVNPLRNFVRTIWTGIAWLVPTQDSRSKEDSVIHLCLERFRTHDLRTATSQNIFRVSNHVIA